MATLVQEAPAQDSIRAIISPFAIRRKVSISFGGVSGSCILVGPPDRAGAT